MNILKMSHRVLAYVPGYAPYTWVFQIRLPHGNAGKAVNLCFWRYNDRSRPFNKLRGGGLVEALIDRVE